MRKIDLTDEIRVKVLRAHQLGHIYIISVEDSFILVSATGLPQPNISTAFAIKLIKAETIQHTEEVKL